MNKLFYGTDPLQFGELYIPTGSGPHPTVVLIHGGFWRAAYDLTLMTGLAKNLARQGIAAWNIEYRRVGNPGGGWPGTLLDVAQATDYLQTIATSYQLDIRQVVAVGHSAGGHLALWLAARSKIPPQSILAGTATPLRLAGAISLAGVVDLEQSWRLNLGRGAANELLDGGFDEVPERYAGASPAALLPIGIPQVLIHGTEDDRVPLIVSQDYAKKALALRDPVTLIALPGADHFVVIDPTSAAWHTSVGEIRRLYSLARHGSNQ